MMPLSGSRLLSMSQRAARAAERCLLLMPAAFPASAAAQHPVLLRVRIQGRWSTGM